MSFLSRFFPPVSVRRLAPLHRRHLCIFFFSPRQHAISSFYLCTSAFSWKAPRLREREREEKRREKGAPKNALPPSHRTSANTLSARSGAILPSVISASRLSTSASPRAVWRYSSAGEVEGAAMFLEGERERRNERERETKSPKEENDEIDSDFFSEFARPVFFVTEFS